MRIAGQQDLVHAQSWPTGSGTELKLANRIWYRIKAGQQDLVNAHSWPTKAILQAKGPKEDAAVIHKENYNQ